MTFDWVWAVAVTSLTLAVPAQAQTLAPGTESAKPTAPASDDRGRAVACMASAIAYEAAQEPVEGQQAVAEVILNRVRNPAFPKTICGVVYAGSERRTGCQFSFTCDGSMAHRMSVATMQSARAVAEAALDGRNPPRVFGATHYHANYVAPYWAPSLVRIGQVGAHIFYRTPGATDVASTPLPFVARGEAVRAETAEEANASPPPAASAPRPFLPWGLALSTATQAP